MELNWRNKLAELQIPETELSKRLKTYANLSGQIEAAVEQLEIDLGNASSEAETDQIQASLDENKEALRSLDEEFTAEIEKWAPKRQKYAEQTKKLRRGKNAAGSADASTDTPPVPPADAAPAANDAPPPAEPIPGAGAAEPQTEPAPIADDPAPAPVATGKKTGILWIAAAVVVGIATVGAINLLNKE